MPGAGAGRGIVTGKALRSPLTAGLSVRVKAYSKLGFGSSTHPASDVPAPIGFAAENRPSRKDGHAGALALAQR
jgi:hypothetical protein